LDLKRCQ